MEKADERVRLNTGNLSRYEHEPWSAERKQEQREFERQAQQGWIASTEHIAVKVSLCHK